MQALLARAERVDPAATALFRMSPETRQQYEAWRADCEAEIAAITARDGEGGAYAALVRGEYAPPVPPRAVAESLEMTPAPVLPDDATIDELAAIYAAMLEG